MNKSKLPELDVRALNKISFIYSFLFILQLIGSVIVLILYPEPLMFVYCFFAMLIWYHLTVVLSNVSEMAQQMESIKEDLHELKSSVRVPYIPDSELENYNAEVCEIGVPYNISDSERENYNAEIGEIGIKTPEVADFDTPETKEDIEKWLKGE
jgi:hypothetical protein